jgi:hypothetical protein
MFLQMGLDRANQIESLRQMTLSARPKILEISTSMRSLSSGWRDNGRPSGGSAWVEPALQPGHRGYGWNVC